jgi:undecaprenyl-diphosphatase
MDFQLEQWINRNAGSNHIVDAIMVILAQWSESFFIALVLGWFVFGALGGRPKERQGAMAALLASGLALAADQLISHAWSRPRPFVGHPGSVHVLLAHSADSSFPSDHVAAAVAIGVVIWAVHRRLGLASLVLAAAVGYARVFVGDHYPGDVVGAAIVGLVAGGIMASAWVGKALNSADTAVRARLSISAAPPNRP